MNVIHRIRLFSSYNSCCCCRTRSATLPPPPSLAAKNDYCRLYLIWIVGSFPAKELNVEILSTGLSIRVETKNQFKRRKFEMKVDAVRVVILKKLFPSIIG